MLIAFHVQDQRGRPLSGALIQAKNDPYGDWAGVTNPCGDFFATPRNEWDPETLVEAEFDVQTTMRLFEEANAAYETRMRAS